MLGRGHNFQCYFGLTTSEITGIVSVHPLHICNSLKLFLSKDPSCSVSKIILAPLMTLMSWPTQFFNQLSYSTLCPILIGYALPSLFSATIRAFILCTYWTLIGVIVLTVKTIFFPTRAIWDVHPLCCTSKDLEGIPIFDFPYQQLIPSLAITYGISFHIWLWGQVGEVKSRRAETSMNWHLFVFFFQHTWMQQRTCYGNWSCLSPGFWTSRLAQWPDLKGLKWQSFSVVAGRSEHGHSLNVRVRWQNFGKSCEFNWSLKIGH